MKGLEGKALTGPSLPVLDHSTHATAVRPLLLLPAPTFISHDIQPPVAPSLSTMHDDTSRDPIGAPDRSEVA